MTPAIPESQPWGLNHRLEIQITALWLKSQLQGSNPIIDAQIQAQNHKAYQA